MRARDDRLDDHTHVVESDARRDGVNAPNFPLPRGLPISKSFREKSRFLRERASATGSTISEGSGAPLSEARTAWARAPMRRRARCPASSTAPAHAAVHRCERSSPRPAWRHIVTDCETIRAADRKRTAELDLRKPVADVEPRSAVVGFRFSPAQPRRGYGQKSIRPQARRANPQRTIGGVRRVLARGRAVLVCTGGALG